MSQDTTTDQPVSKGLREDAKARTPERLETALSENRTAIAETIDAIQHKLGLDGIAPADLGRGLMTGASLAMKTARKYPKTSLAIGGGLALFLVGRASLSAVDEDDDLPDLGGHDWFIAAKGLQEDAEAEIALIDEDIAVHKERVSQGIATHGTGVRNFRAEKVAIRNGLAADLETAFRIGLDDLSRAAQDEMAGVRARQYRDQLESPTTLSGIADTIFDHPLAAGAVALAISSVVSALRPKGDTGSDLAAEREKLTRRAKELVREERDNAVKLADVAARELASKSRI